MEKWADYQVSGVCYNTERTRIVKLKVHEDKGDSTGDGQDWSREQVISAIERGKCVLSTPDLTKNI